MSELTTVEIRKKTATTLELRIISFRDDALPNPELKDSSFLQIATTGLVFYANYLSYHEEHLKKAEQFYNKLQDMETTIKSNLFQESTVRYFIQQAEVVSYYNHEGCEWIDELPFEITPQQRETLYQLQIQYYQQQSQDDELTEFLEEHPSADSNFNLDVLYLDANKLNSILGAANARSIETQVTIALTFKDPSYLSYLAPTNTYSFDTPLDSYLYDWL